MSESFSTSNIKAAIEQWLEYGEQSLDKLEGHKGYFSGNGWAARCLRFVNEHVNHCWRPYPANADDMASFLEGYSDSVSNEELRESMIRTADLLRKHPE